MHQTPGKYRGLRRLSDERGFFSMSAVSQRPAMEQLIASLSEDGQFTFIQVAQIKSAILSVWSRHSTAVLVDPQYGYPAAAAQLDHQCGLIIAVEQGHLERGAGGIRNHLFSDDIVGKAKRMGADAVNLSLWFRPDVDKDVIAHQKGLVQTVGQQCSAMDIPFLLSPLSYPHPNTSAPNDNGVSMLDVVAEFQREQYKVDMFQLESLVTLSGGKADGSPQIGDIEEAYSKLGAEIKIPWVMLTAGSSVANFQAALGFAFKAGASGFLAGRSFWVDQAREFPDLAKIKQRLSKEMVPVAIELTRALHEHGKPWFKANSFASRQMQPENFDHFFDHYAALA